MASVEAPQPPADVVPRGHDEPAKMKQPWKTQTVSDRDKERKQRRNSDGKKPAVQGGEAASRARSEGLPPLKREGSRRSRSRSRSRSRGRAPPPPPPRARSRSPERSRRPQSRSRSRERSRGRRSRSRERRSRSRDRGGANSQRQHSRSRERRKERPVPLERRQSSGEGSRPEASRPAHSTHSVEPARGEESKAQLCREQREQTRQARRREEREEAERSKGGGSGQGSSTPKENSSRTSGGSLPVSPAVRPSQVAAVTNGGGGSRLSEAVSAAAAVAAVDEEEWNEDDLASFETGGGTFLDRGAAGYEGGGHHGPRSPELELEPDSYGDGSPREGGRGSELSQLMKYAQAKPPVSTAASWHSRPEAQQGSVQLVNDAALQAPRYRVGQGLGEA